MTLDDARLLKQLVVIDRTVDAAEGEGIEARWKFGRLLIERRVGKKLPIGLLAEVAEATGKSRRELQARMQVADTYADRNALRNALHNGDLASWHDFCAGKTAGQLLVSSEDEDWYTPSKYIEAAREVLGEIDLDPASCTAANTVIRAATFYTKQQNGLSLPWQGRIWLNPPYLGLAGSFIARLISEYETGNITAAIALVNSHCTDAEWFQGLWDYTLCFTDHRINFESPRETTSGATHGSVFVYLGKTPESFAHHFAQFGRLVVAYK